MAFVQKGPPTNAVAASPTFTINGTTAGNHLCLAFAWVNGNSASTPPVAPSGWSTAQNAAGVAGIAVPTFFTGASIFYLENIAGGNVTITMNPGGTGTWGFAGEIVESNNIVTSGSLDVSATNNSAASVTSGSVTSATTTGANRMIFAVIAPTEATGTNYTLSNPPATGYTSIYTVSDGSVETSVGSGYKEVGVVGIQSASWTWSLSGEYVAVIAAFQEVAAPLSSAPIAWVHA